MQAAPPVHPPHCTLPLPHALGRAPHVEPRPPSAASHSGGGGWHKPATQACPIGHAHCLVWPHPSVIVPQNVWPLAEHASVPQNMPPSLGI
jgi:hypothetical protein